MDRDIIRQYRSFLKDSIRKAVDFSGTDQHRGVAPPPIAKPQGKGGRSIDLPRYDEWKDLGGIDLKSAIGNRESRRTYGNEPVTLEELSFLLFVVSHGIPHRGLDPQGKKEGSGSSARQVPFPHPTVQGSKEPNDR